MALPDNPFSRAYAAVKHMLTDSPEFMTLVKGNLITYDSETNRDPKKTNVQTADLPEVIIVDDGYTGNLHDSSSTSKIDQRYSICISTGDYRYIKIACDLNWIILCQMAKWKEYIGSITWGGKPFVFRATPTNIEIGESNPQRNRGINGWSTVVTLTLSMTFTTKSLVYAEPT